MKSTQIEQKISTLQQELVAAIVDEITNYSRKSMDLSGIPLDQRPYMWDPFADDYAENITILEITVSGITLDNDDKEIPWSSFYSLSDLLNLLSYLEIYNQDNYESI